MIKLKNRVLRYVTFSKDRIIGLKQYITMLVMFGIITNLPMFLALPIITFHILIILYSNKLTFP